MLRGRRFASQIMRLVQDFVPEKCRRELYDYLQEAGYKANIELLNVPPEYDHLKKLDFEKKMLETIMPTVIGKTDGQPV